MTLRPQIGRYTLTRRLGVGGMGEVWMGQREALGGAAKRVAIKLMNSDKARDPNMRAMFLEEARLSMQLHGANIVQVFDADETEDQLCYMVMEWIEGLDLAQLMKKLASRGERLSDAQVGFVIGEVLKALALAHELVVDGVPRTVIHRDVSPQNVMISIHGEVKLMDFGIARVSSEETSGLHVKGKLRYMPPEQLRGETRQPTLDLFAVGAMLHELLDGVRFRSKVIDEGQLFGMVIDGSYPPMVRAAETVPEGLEALRRGLLEPLAQARIPSARAAFRQLSAWPGYRDARFELDELVRHVLSTATTTIAAAPESAYDASTRSVVTRPSAVTRPASQPRVVVHGHTQLAPSPFDSQATEPSATGHAGASMSVSDRLPATEPSLTHSRQLAPAPAVTPARFPVPLAVGLAGGGLLCVAGALSLVLVSGTKDDLQSEVPPTAEVASNPSPSGPAPDLASQPQPEEPPTVEKPESEPEPEPEPEPEQTPIAPTVKPPDPEKPKKQPVSRTKVTMRLSSGTNWAEVVVGRRSYVLDNFATKQHTLRLRPGTQTFSYRTKAGAPMKTTRLTIPEETLTLEFSPSGVESK
ncbi:protein kinase [Pseudenhygromyxa sp. WMMC2535]|uniref:serine/threonine protein kinase n=1 Tax=Pseudenhygromyxa sp. WMMC2535 TaxID=2712867 RepID=UPI001557D854|nr:serine/threonine-protein kinase [Pseudenhygromyxa sp. WMMC2535]NVB42872.1 protein kinase [Pseudenhygromyxa sp. WMMC2535]